MPGTTKLEDLPTAAHPQRKVLHGVGIVLLASAFAAWNLSPWPARLRYPGEWCGVEGMRLAEMLHLRQGIPIYAPASAERFDATIYGPLYYLIGSRLVDPEKPVYLPLRLLAALGTLGCAAVSGALAFQLGRRSLAAVLAPLIVLSYGFFSFYGTSSRADSLALCLSVAGALLAYRFRKDPKILLAAPIFLVAFFYKQQFVAAPLAVFIFLILEKRFRRAAAFAGLMTVGVFGLLALFQFVVFPGQAFFTHFYSYNLLPFSWTQFKGGVILFAVLFVVPTLVGLEYVRVHRDRFLACYLLAATIIALLAVGKEGSDTNYFLESIVILAALYAAFLAERLAQPAQAVELLVLMAVMLFSAQFFTPSAPRPDDFARDRELQNYLLKHYPTPLDILECGLSPLVNEMKQISRGKLGEKRAKALYTAAETSVGIREGRIGMTFELQELLHGIEECERFMNRIEEELAHRLQDVPYSRLLLSMKGIGEITVAGLIGEVGDFSKFRTISELLKCAGLNLFEISSGKRQGSRHISKKGRALMRKLLYFAALCTVRQGGIMHDRYQRYLQNGMKKMKALVAISRKLLGIMFALVRNHTFYQEDYLATRYLKVA
ncbi:MAG: transposase [Acidobacteriia bacterium]|nr:transposase [Terriglobia bacterium]